MKAEENPETYQPNQTILDFPNMGSALCRKMNRCNPGGTKVYRLCSLRPGLKPNEIMEQAPPTENQKSKGVDKSFGVVEWQVNSTCNVINNERRSSTMPSVCEPQHRRNDPPNAEESISMTQNPLTQSREVFLEMSNLKTEFLTT